MRSCGLDLGCFLVHVMTLMALKAAVDVNQGVTNFYLGVKANKDVKKSTKATADVKPLKSTLTMSVD